MLSERLPLLPTTLPDFRPCPPASDRAGWEALPLPARRRLLAAGDRLQAVLRRCEGMSNKDLARFTSQIEALCDKWQN